MSNSATENETFLEYLNLEAPENIAGQENLLYEIFFRRFTFRRLDHLNSLKSASDFTEFPKGAMLHTFFQNFLMSKPVELVPDMTSAPLRANPKRKYIMHVTQPVDGVIPFEEKFILPPKGLLTTLINFKKRNQRYCRPITDITKFPTMKRTEVLSVISYESLYRARIMGIMKQSRRFKYIWTTVLNMICKMPDRQHFIPIPVGDTQYERGEFIMSFKRYDKATIRHENDPWYLFMMHFIGWLHCEPTQSIFEKIPQNILNNINLVLFAKDSLMVYNLGTLKKFNTEHDTILLRFIAQLNALASAGYRTDEFVDYGDKEVVYDAVEDKTTLLVKDDEAFEDDGKEEPEPPKPVVEPPANPDAPADNKTEEEKELGATATTKLNQLDEEKEKLLKLANPDADLTVNTVNLVTPVSASESPTKLYIDSKAIPKTVQTSIPQKQVEKDMQAAKDEIASLNIPMEHFEIDEKFLEVKAEDKDLNIPIFKEQPSHETLVENSKKFIKEMEDATAEFIKNVEGLSPAQRTRAEKVSTAWQDVKLPSGKTLKEAIEQVPDESVDTDHISCLEDDPDILDKTILDSCNKKFDLDYMNKMFEHDLASNLLTFGKVGMFLKDMSIEDVSDSLNDLQCVSLKFEDVHHKEHAFKFNIPKINEKGFIKVNGTLKVMKKQRIDMPICKVSPTLVRLCSDNNKYRIIRNETSAHNFLSYIGRLLRKGDATKIKYEFATIKLNQYKIPYEYAELAQKYRSIDMKISRDFRFFFDYENRWTWLRGLGLKEKEIKDIETREGRLQGVIMAIDEYGTEYYSRLDGSTVMVDNKGEQVRTSLIDILCEELEVDMPPLSEWVDMNLLGKEMIVPIIIVLGYQFGLSHMLEYTKTKYFVLEKNERMQRNWSDIVVRFKDKTLIIPRYPLINSLIFAGLNNYDLRDISMEDMDGKDIYYDIMRSKGKSIHLLKGVDNYFDLFMDAITRDILEQMGEPTNCKDLLIRAVQLLSTEDHKDVASATNFRFRSYERVNAAIYKTLAMSFANYRARGVGATHKWTFPDYEIMKMITEDQLLENVDTINPVNEIKYYAEYSHSGVGGRKSADTFMIPDRQFAEDAVGTMSEATVDNSKTGFAASVTDNPIFANLRGMVITKKAEDLEPNQLLSAVGMLVPFGTNDDGKRKFVRPRTVMCVE